MEFDDLQQFLQWWLTNRVLNSPQQSTNFNGELSGVVLYRQAPYQVQLFIVQPNSDIEPHIHPNVDSYEVFISGDINFMCDDQWYPQSNLGNYIRVKPDSWHGGKFGERGGCFISVQKWLNGVPPTSVGDDWHDKQNSKMGTATKQLSKE